MYNDNSLTLRLNFKFNIIDNKYNYK